MPYKNFVSPANVDEALALLAEHGGKVSVLAGGTDLVPKINCYELCPEIILYLGNLGLNTIKEVDGGLEIGACVTISAFLENDLIAKKAPILRQAAFDHSSPAIRSAGTIGGNIVNASPAADMVGPLYVLDAKLKLVSSAGERVVPIEEFFTGPGKTVCAPNELLKSICIPAPKGGMSFVKLGRRKAQSLAVIAASVRLEVEGGVCKAARIALSSVAPTVIRCNKAEQMLAGKAVDASLLRAVAEAAIAESSPIDDVRSSAWYRSEAGKGIARQALFAAANLEYTD